LLAIEAVKKNNLEVLCLILNEINSNTLFNKDSIAGYTDVPILSFSKDNLEFFHSEIERLI
jgi:dethiobiotin synthetase